MGEKKEIDKVRERGGETPRYYEVFARVSSTEALMHVGSVEAPNEHLAQARAWYVYDQHKWIEMCIVPLDAVITVTENGRTSKIKMN